MITTFIVNSLVIKCPENYRRLLNCLAVKTFYIISRHTYYIKGFLFVWLPIYFGIDPSYSNMTAINLSYVSIYLNGLDTIVYHTKFLFIIIKKH